MNKMQGILPELLAPAGDKLSLERAVMAGADAVYLGVNEFSARAAADNFDLAELKAYIEFCHLYGVRVYIAFNTLIKESELDNAKKMINSIALAGADGIIIADIGLLPYLQKTSLPVHISTQAGVHNLQSARFFASLGADRVVLARETTAKDIRSISDSTSLDIEYFVQGALCVSFSGRCLMAGEMGGGSGNRGTCSQPCRLKYTLSSNGTEQHEYMLSASDLCLLGKLNKLSSLGVTSYKIEGRMRRPEYVAEAVRAYRSVLEGVSLPKDELPHLKRAFNRGGYTEGYLFTDKVMSTRIQGHAGERCGKVLRVFKKSGYSYAEVYSSVPLTKGDGLKILRDGVESGGADITSAEVMDGSRYIIPVSIGVRAGDEIYLTTDKSRADYLNSLEKRLPLTLSLTARIGEPLTLFLTSGASHVKHQSDFIIPPSKGAILAKEEVAKLLSRLGDTPFMAKDVTIDTDSQAFIPKSQINRIRRDGVDKLIQRIITDFIPSKKKNQTRKNFINPYKKERGSIRAAEIQKKEQLTAIPKGTTHIVYRPQEYTSDELLSLIKEAEGYKVYLALPQMITHGDSSLLSDLVDILKDNGGGFFAENYGAVQLAREQGLPYGGELNIYNTDALFVLEDADFLVAAYELSLQDAEPLLQLGVLYFAVGYIPVMTLRHCPIKLLGSSCVRCGYKDNITYTNGKKVFKGVRSKLQSCSFTIYSHRKREERLEKAKHNTYVSLVDF